MDETNQKLTEAPRRSKKTLYLILILVFLTILISVMFFNKERIEDIKIDEEEQRILNDLRSDSRFELTKEEEERVVQDLQKDSTNDLSEEEQEIIIKSLQ